MEAEINDGAKSVDVKRELNDFCSTTTAHGFVYFTDNNKVKRLFWGIICLGKDFLVV